MQKKKQSNKTERIDAHLKKLIRLAKSNSAICEEILLQLEMQFVRSIRDLREFLNENQSEIDFSNDSMANASDVVVIAKHLQSTTMKGNHHLEKLRENVQMARNDLLQVQMAI
jgi:hypothetical protein